QQGSGDWQAAPQPSAPEWNQDNQAAGAQGWNAAPAQQGWGAPGAGQPAQADWNTGAQPQPSATDWNTGVQPQPSATDWNQQQQGWNAGAPGQQALDPNQQGWDQSQQAGQGVPGYGQQQQWQQQPLPPKAPSAFANVFDFSFKKFALPEAAGTIFLIAVIAIAVKWVFDLAYLLTLTFDVVDLMQVIIGGLAMSLLYILVVRVFLEGMTALVTRSKQDKEPSEPKDATDSAVEA
ncbi:MAG: DUF4282 domain-containing protein, partial [Arachnia sp.]